jgi:hypothetical protein
MYTCDCTFISLRNAFYPRSFNPSPSPTMCLRSHHSFYSRFPYFARLSSRWQQYLRWRQRSRYSDWITGWKTRGSILGIEKSLLLYPKRPEELCGPPCLRMGSRSSRPGGGGGGGKAAGTWYWPQHNLVPKPRTSAALLLCCLTCSWRVQKNNFVFSWETYVRVQTEYTRWFKYDRDKLWLVYTQIVPVIFEPPCRVGVFRFSLHCLF